MRLFPALTVPGPLQVNGRQASSSGWMHDVAAIAFLSLLAGFLYFSQVNRMGLSADGFLLTYLMQTGDLQAFNVLEAKEPGRPFLGLAWRLAALFMGGTATGYNAFMAGCLLFSALFIYFLVRTLAPRQPVWALLAAAFKIVWMANHEVFDNSGLAIYFAEALFWLALWALAIALSRRQAPAWPQVLVLPAIMMACLVVLVGTYQTPWPVVLICPLALFAVQATPPRRGYAFLVLGAWYLAAVPMMLWCYLLSRQFVSRIGVPSEDLLRRVAKGIWDSTAKTLYFPFDPRKGYPHAGFSLPVVLFTVGLAALLVWSGLRSWPAFRELPPKRLLRNLAIAGIVAVFVAVVEVLPPSLLWEPSYGNRTVHYSSLGTLVGIIAGLAWVCHRYRVAGCAIGAVAAIVLFAYMAQESQDIGNQYGVIGYINRRFWEDVSTEISRVDEGTVVLLDGPPRGVATVDSLSTTVLRQLTETQLSFFVTDGHPVYDPVRKTYQVTSVVDLDQVDPVVTRGMYIRKPKILDKPRTFEVPPNRVVWAEWNLDKLRLKVLPERSALQRLHTNIPSTFGQVLFPRSSRTITAP